MYMALHVVFRERFDMQCSVQAYTCIEMSFALESTAQRWGARRELEDRDR